MAKRNKTHRVSISHFHPELIARIRALAKREHRNLSAFVMNVLAEYVKARTPRGRPRTRPDDLSRIAQLAQTKPERVIELPDGSRITTTSETKHNHE
jgi:hypothetical protein